MRELAYHLVNVFAIAGDPFSGNPLCVFEDGRGLDDQTMQALALQFNLSETTFILPSARATAAVRIFTPAFEMPFAGHPTLGTAHIVRRLTGAGDAVTLDLRAGIIPVAARGDRWTLQAKPPNSRPAEASAVELAQMLGLDGAADIAGTPLWVDTGSEQLVVPLASPAAVRRCAPDPVLLSRHASLRPERCLVYVIADAGPGEIEARFFFKKGSAVLEDPGTGSACANLGGWLLANGVPPPLVRTVRQGDGLRRPSRLGLEVDAERRIHVAGEVFELGRGVLRF